MIDDVHHIDVDGRPVRVGRVIADQGGTHPRNAVERCFHRLEQFRGLATRHAKRAACHRAEIVLARIVLHLR